MNNKKKYQDQILKTTSYKKFRELLLNSNCQLCGLHKTRTKLVVDRGNPASSIMMIGEAPGRNEDLEGKAFVGRSGKLLDSLSHEAGIDTKKDVLIANVIKCRPPQNRVPTREEAKMCLPYLYKQIKIVKPKIIVLLGRTALKHLLPAMKEKALKEVVGKFFKNDLFVSANFFLCYHPAYILRDPRKKPVMLKMLKTLARETRG